MDGGDSGISRTRSRSVGMVIGLPEMLQAVALGTTGLGGGMVSSLV